ncbi:MAG: hypothetical protein R2806_17450 [Saprospiraceae bacterium]
MSAVDWTGFAGVSLLVAAYLLNLLNVIKKDSLTYLLANTLGAGIACLASYLLHYLPFILLEGCWSLVSLIALIRFFQQKPARR